jgi:alpha-glucosidase
MPHSFRYWTGEFQRFFDPGTGFDIDGAWIDMNDPASVRRSYLLFVVLIHTNVLMASSVLIPAIAPPLKPLLMEVPPNRTSPVPNPNSTIFGNSKLLKRSAPSHVGEDLLNPPYAINNTAKTLSDRTISVGLSLLTHDI